MANNLKQQSNPFSTGGGGVNFETRVQATFVIALLAGLYVPCLSSTMKAKKIKFQSKYEGINTDDFLLYAVDNKGSENKLFAQIKHEISMTERDIIFTEVINNAWHDFKSDHFNLNADLIVLITGTLSKNDINNILPILDWAKYASSSSEFIKKVNTKGFTSKDKINKLNVFRHQLNLANQNPITDEEFWLFLKTFQIISYDLDSKSSIVANLLCSLIETCSSQTPSLVLSKVITYTQEFNQNAGTLELDNVSQEIRNLFDKKIINSVYQDIRLLKERSDYVFNGINSCIIDMHVIRADYLTDIYEKLSNHDFLFVTGARGTGKSAIIRDFILDRNLEVSTFYLRTEDLDKGHINDVFASFGLASSLSQLEGYFSLLPEKILVIESLEKILELNLNNALIDLLQFLKKQTGWKIIATGRDYAYQQIMFNYVQPRGILYESINVGPFSDDQIEELGSKIPALKTLLENQSLNELLHIPFYIELAMRAINNGAKFNANNTEKEFKEIIWQSVISRDSDRKLGMHIKRKMTFIEIAKKRAKEMTFGVDEDDYDSEVIAKLEADNLIHRDSKKYVISPKHDVLEDWALEEFISKEYAKNRHDIKLFLRSIGNEPAINRAFRLWFFQQIKYKEINIDFIYKLLLTDNIDNHWKDEVISALLQSDCPDEFIKTMTNILLENECYFLIRFCFILRLTCQKPVSLQLNNKAHDSHQTNTLFLKPNGKGWQSIFDFIYENLEKITDNAKPQLIQLMDEWCKIINIQNNLPEFARTVGLIALWLLEPIKDSYQDNDKKHREIILSILIRVSLAIDGEFNELMEKDVFISQKPSERLAYVDTLINLLFVSPYVPFICKYSPKLIIKLVWHECLSLPIEENEDIFGRYARMGFNEYFGLEYEKGFFPASGMKGPFKPLLNFHTRLGLDFIIQLFNTTAQSYANSDFSKAKEDEEHSIMAFETVAKQIELTLNDGTVIKQYASPYLWKGYRGSSTLPYILQCALMALENWLIEIIPNAEINLIEWIFDYTLRASNSVMPTSVLASIAVGFPRKVGKAAYPLLRNYDLYFLDIKRFANEMGENHPHWFGIDNDIMTPYYRRERIDSNQKSWRKNTLETLLCELQLNELYREDVLEILDELSNIAKQTNNENLKFLIYRSDSRQWEVIADQENNRLLLQNSSNLPNELQYSQQVYQKKHQHDTSIHTLYVWTHDMLDLKKVSDKKSINIDKALLLAKTLFTAWQENEIQESYSMMALGAIIKTAAICMRDHAKNLTDEDLEWCSLLICEAAIKDANNDYSELSDDISDSFGSAACAYVLPILFDYTEEDEKEQLKELIVIALTHPNATVRKKTAKGIRDFLWQRDAEFATNCLYGMIEFPKFMKENCKAWRFYYIKKHELDEAIKNWENLIRTFRQNLIQGKYQPILDDVELSSHLPWFISVAMFIVPLGSEEQNHILLIEKLINILFENEYKYKSHFSDQDSDKELHHEIKREIEECFIEHIVFSRNKNFHPYKSLLIEACQKAPAFMYSVKVSFEAEMERKNEPQSIWLLWNMLAPDVKKLAQTEMNVRYSGIETDSVLLLKDMLYSGRKWQGHIDESRYISGGANAILQFAEETASNSYVFEGLASLIHYFPTLFFNKGISILANYFDKNSSIISKRLNTAYYLEMSIQHYLQVENLGSLPKEMFNSCMILLNGVIETGSARAYYLREHLIRSRKIEV